MYIVVHGNYEIVKKRSRFAKEKKSVSVFLKNSHVCRGTPCIQRSRFSVRFEFSKRFRYATLEKSIRIVRDLNLECIRRFTYGEFENFQANLSFYLSLYLFLLRRVAIWEMDKSNALFSWFLVHNVILRLSSTSVLSLVSIRFRSRICTDTISYSWKFCIFSDTRDKRE